MSKRIYEGFDDSFEDNIEDYSEVFAGDDNRIKENTGSIYEGLINESDVRNRTKTIGTSLCDYGTDRDLKKHVADRLIYTVDDLYYNFKIINPNLNSGYEKLHNKMKEDYKKALRSYLKNIVPCLQKAAREHPGRGVRKLIKSSDIFGSSLPEKIEHVFSYHLDNNYNGYVAVYSYFTELDDSCQASNSAAYYKIVHGLPDRGYKYGVNDADYYIEDEYEDLLSKGITHKNGCFYVYKEEPVEG